MGLMESIDIGANALKVHGKRIDVHAKTSQILILQIMLEKSLY